MTEETKVFCAFRIDGSFVAFWRQKIDARMGFYDSSHHGREVSIYPSDRMFSLNRGEILEGGSNQDIQQVALSAFAEMQNPLNAKTIRLSNLGPGKYYRRIWRGVYDENPFRNFDAISPAAQYGKSYFESRLACLSLFEYLAALFQYIEPTSENLNSYSHKTRELLILTCTEIETSFRSILDENCFEPPNSFYSTRQYITLCEPLHLREWHVSLSDYPELDPWAPFSTWNNKCPTKSLGWYDAYNAVKHHREAKFKHATFGNVIKAVAALHVLQCAQWGPDPFGSLFGGRSSPFSVERAPSFDAGDVYIPSLEAEKVPESVSFFKQRRRQ